MGRGIHVLHSGWLHKRGKRRNRAFQRRWFTLLSNKQLEYRDSASSKSVNGAVDLSRVVAIGPSFDAPDSDAEFVITGTERDWELRAESSAEREQWIAVLDKVIKSKRAHCRCLLSGHLVKQGRNFASWKRRYFVLTPRVLAYWEREQDAEFFKRCSRHSKEFWDRGIESAKGFMTLADSITARIDSDGSGRHLFFVKSAERELRLEAASAEELDQWSLALLRVQSTKSQRHSSSTSSSSTSCTRPPRRNPSTSTTTEMHCVCGDSSSRGVLVSCSSCGHWLHADCVALDEDDLPDTWTCPNCASTTKQRRRKSGESSSRVSRPPAKPPHADRADSVLQTHHDASGRKFFFNPVSGESSWTKPDGQRVDDLVCETEKLSVDPLDSLRSKVSQDVDKWLWRCGMVDTHRKIGKLVPMLADLHSVFPFFEPTDKFAFEGCEPTPAQVKKLFHHAVRLVHPDKNTSDCDDERHLRANAVFNAVRVAYDHFTCGLAS